MDTVSFSRLAPASTWTGEGWERSSSLLHRIHTWLLHRRAMAELRGADPRACRDMGITLTASTDLVRTFGVDPTPLWGIGEVPMPQSENSRLSQHR